MMLMIQFLMQKWVIRWDCGFHSSKWDTTKTHFRRSQGVVKQFPVGWLSTIAFTLCTVILAHLGDSVMIMQVPCSSMKYRNEHYVCTNVSCSDLKLCYEMWCLFFSNMLIKVTAVEIHWTGCSMNEDCVILFHINDHMIQGPITKLIQHLKRKILFMIMSIAFQRTCL